MPRKRLRPLPRRFFSSPLASMTPRKLVFLLVLLFLGFLVLYWERRTGDFLEGVVTNVVDGDTLVVKVEGESRRVRLIGVDTPETVHPRKPVQYLCPSRGASASCPVFDRDCLFLSLSDCLDSKSFPMYRSQS